MDSTNLIKASDAKAGMFVRLPRRGATAIFTIEDITKEGPYLRFTFSPWSIWGETWQQRKRPSTLINAYWPNKPDVPGDKPLVTTWCKCGDKEEFLCYPDDGECSCGVYKHHVHCTCGAISQVG